MRAAQPFPNLGTGVSSFLFPKRRESYRVVTCRVTAFFSSGGGAQLLLTLSDGDNNRIYSASGLLAAPNVTTTWNFGDQPINSNETPQPGGMMHIGIPSDLWVLPQWNLELSINPNAGTDLMTSIVLQTEWYPAKKESDNIQPQAQSSSS